MNMAKAISLKPFLSDPHNLGLLSTVAFTSYGKLVCRVQGPLGLLACLFTLDRRKTGGQASRNVELERWNVCVETVGGEVLVKSNTRYNFSEMVFLSGYVFDSELSSKSSKGPIRMQKNIHVDRYIFQLSENKLALN